MALWGWADRSSDLRGALEHWGVKPVYASSFVEAFAKPLSEGLARLEKSFTSPEQRLAMLELGGAERVACIYQATLAYKTDLMAGLHRGTPVEHTIVAIIAEGHDIAAKVDPALTKYVLEKRQEFCPGSNSVFGPGDDRVEAPNAPGGCRPADSLPEPPFDLTVRLIETEVRFDDGEIDFDGWVGLVREAIDAYEDYLLELEAALRSTRSS